MDVLRASAEEEFLRHQTFSKEAQDAKVFDINPQDKQFQLELKSVTGDELLIRLRSQLFPGRCLLVWIVQNPDENFLPFAETLFMELFEACHLDKCMLRLLRFPSFGFHQFSGRHGDAADSHHSINSYYVRTTRTTILWSFDPSTRTTRGIVIPRYPYQHRKKPYGSDIRLRWNEFATAIEKHYQVLDDGLGLLWLAVLNAKDWIEKSLDAAIRTIREVEAITDHGPYDIALAFVGEGKAKDETDIDRFVACSKQMGLSAVVLADINRHCQFLHDMQQKLAAREEYFNQPPFRDPDAVDVVRAQLEMSKITTNYLSERVRNQMSVLFNLITREDTRASIELTNANLKVAEAAKSDSGAMKTIAIMTMLFLPATFFAALFSMPLLQWDTTPVIKKQFWIYWVFAIPCTLGILAVWAVITHGDTVKSLLASLERRRKAMTEVVKAREVAPDLEVGKEKCDFSRPEPMPQQTISSIGEPSLAPVRAAHRRRIGQ